MIITNGPRLSDKNRPISAHSAASRVLFDRVNTETDLFPPKMTAKSTKRKRKKNDRRNVVVRPCVCVCVCAVQRVFCGVRVTRWKECGSQTESQQRTPGPQSTTSRFSSGFAFCKNVTHDGTQEINARRHVVRRALVFVFRNGSPINKQSFSCTRRIVVFFFSLLQVNNFYERCNFLLLIRCN